MVRKKTFSQPYFSRKKCQKMSGMKGGKMLMVKVEETTQGVLDKISEGFAQKGAF